jgi:hypothetical protein
MKRILTPENLKAGHEKTKRREADEAERAKRWGWKPGDPPVMDETLAMDLRQEMAMKRRSIATEAASGPTETGPTDPEGGDGTVQQVKPPPRCAG